MKRPPKKPATDRSFVIALSRGLDVLRVSPKRWIARQSGNRRAHQFTEAYNFTADLHADKARLSDAVPRFEKYQLAPAAMALGYSALANMGIRHLSDPYRDQLMRETGGAVAIGARDRLSMIYFGQSRSELTVGVLLDVGSKVPIATTAMGRAYLWALPEDERTELLREIREHVGPQNWPKGDGIERAGECVAKYGFAMSAGEWHNDIHAVGVALKLNDGTGPYAFNCGAPAFKFSEVLLKNDIGPRRRDGAKHRGCDDRHHRTRRSARNRVSKS
jgi:DNA-binding IclR family transcriptional regulator